MQIRLGALRGNTLCRRSTRTRAFRNSRRPHQLGSSFEEQLRLAGTYTVEILRGEDRQSARAQPTELELDYKSEIRQNTWSGHPALALARADEVIEWRRDFIDLLGGAAAWPVAALAQQPAMPVVGDPSSSSLANSRSPRDRIPRSLRETGFVEAQNVCDRISLCG